MPKHIPKPSGASAEATLALSRLSPACLMSVVEAHVTLRRDLNGEAVENLGNKITTHGHMLSRERKTEHVDITV
jgi:hypothetical protein